MAIFNKESAQSVARNSTKTTTGEGSLSIIATDVRIIGDIESDGIIRIDGTVEGAIRAGRQVLVGRQGVVHGDISAREIVIGGAVHGTVTASERLEVQASSTIIGDISTKAIAVSEGGKINGTVRISDAAEGASHTSGERSPAIAIAG